jgi:hypothetical protein
MKEEDVDTGAGGHLAVNQPLAKEEDGEVPVVGKPLAKGDGGHLAVNQPLGKKEGHLAVNQPLAKGEDDGHLAVNQPLGKKDGGKVPAVNPFALAHSAAGSSSAPRSAKVQVFDLLAGMHKKPPKISNIFDSHDTDYPTHLLDYIVKKSDKSKHCSVDVYKRIRFQDQDGMDSISIGVGHSWTKIMKDSIEVCAILGFTLVNMDKTIPGVSVHFAKCLKGNNFKILYNLIIIYIYNINKITCI